MEFLPILVWFIKLIIRARVTIGKLFHVFFEHNFSINSLNQLFLPEKWGDIFTRFLESTGYYL